MRRLLLSVLWMVWACGGYHPITEEEIDDLHLSQGVAGNAAMRVGNCMPGVSGACRHETLVAVLWLVPEANAQALEASTDESCDVDLAAASPEAVGATTADLESGQYGASLPPGRYMPVIVQPSGCGSCASGLEGQGTTACALVSVEASRVTKLDVVLDRAAH